MKLVRGEAGRKQRWTFASEKCKEMRIKEGLERVDGVEDKKCREKREREKEKKAGKVFSRLRSCLGGRCRLYWSHRHFFPLGCSTTERRLSTLSRRWTSSGRRCSCRLLRLPWFRVFSPVVIGLAFLNVGLFRVSPVLCAGLLPHSLRVSTSWNWMTAIVLQRLGYFELWCFS